MRKLLEFLVYGLLLLLFLVVIYGGFSILETLINELRDYYYG
jgi:TRAP-type C4-dicarboxylate transport system permease small subunit